MRVFGEIYEYIEDRGFGFFNSLAPSGSEDTFFHITKMPKGAFEIGDLFSFDVETSAKGRSATNIKRESRESLDSYELEVEQSEIDAMGDGRDRFSGYSKEERQLRLDYRKKEHLSSKAETWNIVVNTDTRAEQLFRGVEGWSVLTLDNLVSIKYNKVVCGVALKIKVVNGKPIYNDNTSIDFARPETFMGDKKVDVSYGMIPYKAKEEIRKHALEASKEWAFSERGSNLIKERYDELISEIKSKVSDAEDRINREMKQQESLESVLKRIDDVFRDKSPLEGPAFKMRSLRALKRDSDLRKGLGSSGKIQMDRKIDRYLDQIEDEWEAEAIKTLERRYNILVDRIPRTIGYNKRVSIVRSMKKRFDNFSTSNRYYHNAVLSDYAEKELEPFQKRASERVMKVFGKLNIGSRDYTEILEMKEFIEKGLQIVRGRFFRSYSFFKNEPDWWISIAQFSQDFNKRFYELKRELKAEKEAEYRAMLIDLGIPNEIISMIAKEDYIGFTSPEAAMYNLFKFTSKKGMDLEKVMGAEKMKKFLKRMIKAAASQEKDSEAQKLHQSMRKFMAEHNMQLNEDEMNKYLMKHFDSSVCVSWTTEHYKPSLERFINKYFRILNSEKFPNVSKKWEELRVKYENN